MVSNSLFENSRGYDDSDYNDLSQEIITPSDDLHDYIREVTAIATKEMANTNAVPGETRGIELPEPIPDDIKTAADLRTEVSALGDKRPPLFIALSGKKATALCVSNPYETPTLGTD